MNARVKANLLLSVIRFANMIIIIMIRPNTKTLLFFSTTFGFSIDGLNSFIINVIVLFLSPNHSTLL